MSQLSQIANPADSAEIERYTQIVETAKIAVIDDEPSNIKIVQAYLNQEGYRDSRFPILRSSV